MMWKCSSQFHPRNGPPLRELVSWRLRICIPVSAIKPWPNLYFHFHNWNYEAHTTNHDCMKIHCDAHWLGIHTWPVCYRWWICMFQEWLLLKQDQYWRHWKTSFEKKLFYLRWRISWTWVSSTRLAIWYVFACEVWCLAGVSSVSPSSEQTGEVVQQKYILES